MNTEETIYTYRLTHRVRTGGSGFAAIVFMLIGLLCLLFVHWLLGLLGIALAILVDTKHKTITTCGHCGNEVAPTCRICPTCRADLAAHPRSPWSILPKLLLTLAFLTSLAALWYVLRMR